MAMNTKLTTTEYTLPVQPLVPTGMECARRLCAADEVLHVSHIDADGLSSAAVGSLALSRAGIPHEVGFYNQLDRDAVEEIAATDYDTVLFTDFGSGQVDIISEFEAEGYFTSVISDHHEPADTETEYHLNPLLFDVDGSSELSGATTTYVLARCLSTIQDDTADRPEYEATNKDLAGIALVGATGDMQIGLDGATGANQEIVEEAVEAGVIEAKQDIALYGKQTRPIPKMLEYSTDIRLPGITGSESGATSFLSDTDVSLTDSDGDWKHWVDLSENEKGEIVSELINYAIDRGVPSKRVNQLVGTTYELVDEEERTPLRDVGEFSTLLNSTARYDRADVGLAVCLGDRDDAYQEALNLLKNHQKNISEGIEWVVNEADVTTETHIQWFDATDKIRETIVGIIAGMALGESGIDQHTPIIAFADKPADAPDEQDEYKVSSRATRRLTRDGVDLSVVMQEAAQTVGGDGGGHDIAAGASIPAREHTKLEFVEIADEIVSGQLN